jgi:hypothetical protein
MFSSLINSVSYEFYGTDHAGIDEIGGPSGTEVSAELIALQDAQFAYHSFSQWGSSHRLHGLYIFSTFPLLI